jgi:hypothetical protein
VHRQRLHFGGVPAEVLLENAKPLVVSHHSRDGK